MRVFLVDDEHDSIDMLAVVLANILPGPTYHVFHDGRSALGAARLNWPDAVISDLEMPEMDGHQLAKSLASMRGNAAMPVMVAISGSTVEILKLAADRLFTHSLLKPLDVKKLVEIIDQMPVPQRQSA